MRRGMGGISRCKEADDEVRHEGGRGNDDDLTKRRTDGICIGEQHIRDASVATFNVYFLACWVVGEWHDVLDWHFTGWMGRVL